MAIERTLSIVKPDATRKNLIGKIVARFEQEGLRIAAIRKTFLSRREAEGFYAVHKERPFFGELCDFMSSGPCVVIVLEGENAIAKNREIMGATNPANAAEGTLRKLYAASVGENAVHGSDSADNARIEIAYFFAAADLCPRTR
jgi:nucleoside-diphosphate kinase